MSSLFSSTLYDPIRLKQVADTPEERIRQALLAQMLGNLGFPKGLLAVEKKIATGRRIDILAYMSKEQDLQPLLLVECKAEAIYAEASFRQALGYRKACGMPPFWCLAHKAGIRTFWQENDNLYSVPYLPPYSQLLSKIG
jgi:hypothetical protein